MSYCVRLHPEEQHVVLAGTQDKKIQQWDLETGDMVQVGGRALWVGTAGCTGVQARGVWLQRVEWCGWAWARAGAFRPAAAHLLCAPSTCPRLLPPRPPPCHSTPPTHPPPLYRSTTTTWPPSTP